MKRKILSILSLALFPILAFSQQPPYKNASLPVEVRVMDLLKRMNPEEKFWQLFMIPGDLGKDSTRYRNGIFGFQVNTNQQQEGAAGQLLNYQAGQTAAQTLEKINNIQRYFVEQTRLGIPIIAFDEALHGLVRTQATAFPQAIALSATWDTVLMSKVATAIALEVKARGIRQILSPVVNLATDVRWGRVEETYGEDPFLTTAMGLAFVGAFERRSVITTPKHFVLNHGEGGRDSYPIHLNDRIMEETYFVPFKELIRRGGARSIMTAYNSYDGSPCTANAWLLNEKLKKEWGFRGFVISDASAVGGANVLHYTAADYADAGKKSVENGLDVIFQTDYSHHELFDPHFLDNTMNQSAIDSAVARVLRAKFELGLFEHPYADTLQEEQWSRASHRQLAREAAAKSIVLLKNDGQVLPLDKKYKRIAVIGAEAMEGRLGGYSGPGNDIVTIFDGIEKRAGTSVRVEYAPGVGRSDKEWDLVDAASFYHLVDGKKKSGLKAEYFNNVSLEGAPALTRIDERINFQWTLFSPDPEKINYDFFSARWSGMIVAPETGRFKIGIDGNDGYRLYLDGKLLIDNWQKKSYSTKLSEFSFVKGRAYSIRIEYYEPAGNAWLRLVWNGRIKNTNSQMIDQAVRVAKTSDIALVVVGIEEGEFRDRAILSLPGKQEELIKRVEATGKPVVVLLVGGSAITMSKWIDSVKGVVDVWYPGEAGGRAVADVLFGDVNPAGRLPITFPLSEGQVPLVYNHKPTGRGDDYNDLSGQPLFPFGYGLSYTQFTYSDLRFDKKTISVGESTKVRFKVKNSGKRAGDEVVQLYLRDELASVARPVKELKGFQRVLLGVGEERELEFTITPELLQMLDVNMKTVIEPGYFRIMIGSSSMDIRLRDRLEVR